MGDELPESQSVHLPIDETVKPPISYYVSQFIKALIEEAGTWRLVDCCYL